MRGGGDVRPTPPLPSLGVCPLLIKKHGIYVCNNDNIIYTFLLLPKERFCSILHVRK